ncbi:MAG TPA: MAPEG family protein [Candidatus Limnocylindria bacterium]|nr:MAPEG family protein [Candidatus Limnocylindria bacterium]
MTDFTTDAAFRSYAVCSAILAVKMLLSGSYTTAMRLRHKGFVNAEDAKAFGAASASETEHPAVAHALRIQRNDLENIPLFFAIGLIYVLSGASAFGAAVYSWTFTIARVLHTVAYTFHLQPWRALCYGVGYACIVGMAVQIVF